MNITSLQDKAQDASRFLKAISNKHRLMILCNLVEAERSVGELEKIVGLSQSALSQHLARLRKEEVVKTRREAQTIYYSLQDENIVDVLRLLEDIFVGDSSKLAEVA
ncbi:ArsR/SmtB family transcription factor [Sneathiella litorea]|uniref:Metalloregulator ArsR/SmtB family transcription factor n=1 Tax=Sneathiella litorea TaxID=2606216 RepID=A0A6L8W959_9PROT|nr:metalloregulator ArsR/SmtB family transcription factor [Sneathiella litorea]MZR31239.1 metalloregulator ArsR/SmtB family transcription factor [Sneathiella litorea]